MLFSMSGVDAADGQLAVDEPPKRALGGHAAPVASVKPHELALVSAWFSAYTPQGGEPAGAQEDRSSVLPKAGADATWLNAHSPADMQAAA
jgi:hypothetical protein